MNNNIRVMNVKILYDGLMGVYPKILICWTWLLMIMQCVLYNSKKLIFPIINITDDEAVTISNSINKLD